MSEVKVSNRKQIAQLAQKMRSDPNFRDLVTLLRARLEDARNEYEDTVQVSLLEFNRGRVNELKDLLKTLSVENA